MVIEKKIGQKTISCILSVEAFEQESGELVAKLGQVNLALRDKENSDEKEFGCYFVNSANRKTKQITVSQAVIEKLKLAMQNIESEISGQI